MNAYIQPYNGKTLVFYTKHKIKTRKDAESILNIWTSYEGQVYHDGRHDEAVGFVYGRLTLCEVGEPYVLSNGIHRDFKELHGTLQGDFMPYNNCHEFYI